MQLHRHRDVETLQHEHVFYTSPAVMFILPAVLLAASVGISWAMIAGYTPGIFWCSIVFLAPFVPLVFWINFLPALRPTNWVLKTAGSHVYILLRNYRNAHAPDDGPTVVSFAHNEIASIGKHVLTLAAPTRRNGRKTYWKEYRLELRLRDAAPPEFVAALQAERNRRPPQTGMVRTKSYYPPLMTLDGDGRTIRILWSGRFDHITPRIGKAIALLGGTFLAHDDAVVDRTDVAALSEAQFDDLIVQLLQGNLKLDAVELLTTRRGMSTTEAVRFTDELMHR